MSSNNDAGERNLVGSCTSYKDAGVDIDAADGFIRDYVTERARRTFKPGVLGGIGGFASMFSIAGELRNMVEPVLLSSTDGIGTKMLVARDMGCYDTVGIDLVAMCVNDLVAQGARPLFFLDYIATNKIEKESICAIFDGIAKGCEIAGLSLIGGETAEMPDVYPEQGYDLAGFVVGIADRAAVRPKIASMVDGDILLGIASSGFHSNGYALLRKLGISYDTVVDDTTFGELLLTPTKIYCDALSRVMPYIKGVAHITGGGLPGNVCRTIPSNLCAEIDLNSWPLPRCFKMVMDRGVSLDEALRVFNMGIGMVCVVDAALVYDVKEQMSAMGEECYVIGSLLPRNSSEAVRFV